MRQARIRRERKSYYHCISRVVDRQFVLQEEEKEPDWESVARQIDRWNSFAQ
jgi:hypothetical protein